MTEINFVNGSKIIFDEESYKGNVRGIRSTVKPIGPTIVEFDSEEEYEEFIRYATSKEKTNTPEMNRMRELMKNHVRAKQREH